MSTEGRARFDRYAAAKQNLAEALGDYLAAVASIGRQDAAASLELARQALIHDLNTAVDKSLSTVVRTEVWAEMALYDHAGYRSDRGGA